MVGERSFGHLPLQLSLDRCSGNDPHGHLELVGSGVCPRLYPGKNCRQLRAELVCPALRLRGGQFNLLCSSGSRWCKDGTSRRLRTFSLT